MSFFKSSTNRLHEFNAWRKNLPNPLSLGNKFLNDCLGGIFADDLVIVTARTGGGKTELVTQIALTNVMAGKKVHFFALEAHSDEIEARLKYKLLAQAFFIQKNWRSEPRIPNYQDWVTNQDFGLLDKFEPEVDEHFEKQFANLHTFYRAADFDANVFESYMNRIGEVTDLVIVDHLHYFDLDSDNENSALKKTVKQIKHVTSHFRKPVILVVQLRKQDKRTAGLLPDIEEIHGSSDVGKIATKIIAAAPAKDQPQTDPHIFPTYFRALKNRTDGSRTFYAALCGFDIQKNAYSEKYVLGKLSSNDSEFTMIEPHDVPQWARRQQ